MSDKFERFSLTKQIIDIDRVDIDDLKNLNNPIILDTNFLFVPFEFKLDIIGNIENLVGSKYNLFIYEGTLSELENIERKGEKNKKFLPLIVTMFKRYRVRIIKSNQTYIDDQIMENSHLNYLIATNDKELRQKLWKVPTRVMYMRQKSYLEIK